MLRSWTKAASLARKNPRLAVNKLRTTFRTRVTALADYYFRDGTAAPPNAVCIKLTNACNLRCRMCGQPREGCRPGDPKYAPKEFFLQSVPLETFTRLLDEIASVKPNLYLWGGEPFLYKDLLELVRRAKARKLTVQINTNGLLLAAHAAEIVESGLDDLIVSVDGPEEVHDTVRGRTGTFRRMQEGVAAVIEQKRRRGLKRPVIRVRGTVSPDNFSVLAELIETAETLGADSLNFNWTWFTTPQTGAAHQRLMKELFGIQSLSWMPFVTDVIMDPERMKKYDGLKAELYKLLRSRSRLPISMSPGLLPEQVEAYYENLDETFGRRTCSSVYVKSYILPNGDVTPCPDFPDYICGNIGEKPFLDIWNGERYRQWRCELKKRGLFPICARCCDLFLTDVRFF